MNNGSNPNQSSPSIGIITDIIRQVRLAWRLLLDPRVPMWVKGIIPAALVYVVSPLDFIPDVIPVLGQLDDLAVVVLGFKLFIDLCPPHIVREHMDALLGESQWRVEPGQTPRTSPPPSRPDVVDVQYEVKK